MRRQLRKMIWMATAMGVAAWAVAMVPRFEVQAEGASQPPGKTVFEAEKCATCHSLSAAGIEAKTKSEKLKGPDLGGVTQRHEAEWIKAFLHKQEEFNGEVHKKEFKGSDEELAALIDWLGTFPVKEPS